jgi:hypothetical protein
VSGASRRGPKRTIVGKPPKRAPSPKFGVGDRVRNEKNGREGVVTYVGELSMSTDVRSYRVYESNGRHDMWLDTNMKLVRRAK